MENTESIFEFIKGKLSRLSQGLIYIVFLLYYAWKKPETPKWAKRVVIGALSYLLAPIDAIPDLTPFIGFTDDIGILSMSLITIARYIDDEVKQQAIDLLGKYFKNIDETSISEVDEKI